MIIIVVPNALLNSLWFSVSEHLKKMMIIIKVMRQIAYIELKRSIHQIKYIYKMHLLK